jgi:hypothetical protein
MGKLSEVSFVIVSHGLSGLKGGVEETVTYVEMDRAAGKTGQTF